jgi:hypothetical protein
VLFNRCTVTTTIEPRRLITTYIIRLIIPTTIIITIVIFNVIYRSITITFITAIVKSTHADVRHHLMINVVVRILHDSHLV